MIDARRHCSLSRDFSHLSFELSGFALLVFRWEFNFPDVYLAHRLQSGLP